jgi:hypothetical protein
LTRPAPIGAGTSLNAEWVRVSNTGSRAVSLGGWTLRDVARHVYRIGTYRLAGGSAVTIHTGDGLNGARHRYWGQGWYVWNNDGDTAILKNGSGRTIDRCSYSDSGDAVAC